MNYYARKRNDLQQHRNVNNVMFSESNQMEKNLQRGDTSYICVFIKYMKHMRMYMHACFDHYFSELVLFCVHCKGRGYIAIRAG